MPRILVLLLPETFEAFEHRPIVEELMRADGVVVCDPPKVSYDRMAHMVEGLSAGLAQKQAKRLRKRLPGEPAAVAIFDPAQYVLARTIVAQVEGCELWYRPPGSPGDERLAQLHFLAAERATLVFETADDLWTPMMGLELSSLRGRGGARRAGRR